MSCTLYQTCKKDTFRSGIYADGDVRLKLQQEAKKIRLKSIEQEEM